MKIFILYLLFLLLILNSCTRRKEVNNDLLVIGLESNPTNLDPRYGLDLASSHVIELIFNGLLKKDPETNLVPDLAEKWEIPDDRTYIFYLRKDVRFHDGAELTADDVKYTFDTILDPSLGSPKLDSYKVIEKIEIIDRHTVKFRLKEVFAPFLSNMVMKILPRHIVEKMGDDFAKHPVGTGPFRFVGWKMDEWVHFEANKDYFEGGPRVSEIIYRIIPDETIRILELEKGNIDLIQNGISSDILPRIEHNPGLKIVKRPGTNYSYMGFNMEDPILRDKRVREAFAYAIDIEGIIRYILKGLATPSSGLLSPFNQFYESDVKRFDYSPERSKRLLYEAGYIDPDGDGPEVRFEVVYKTSQNEQRRLIAEVIQEQLKKVGIGVKIKSYEWGTLFSDIRRGNFQIYTLTWVGLTDPDIYYYIFNSKSIPPVGANRGRYINPEIDRLTEEGRIILNIEKRREIYSSIQKIIADDLPYVNLWYATNVAVMKKGIKGFILYPDEDFASLKEVYIDSKAPL
ncbi:MAG: ABC transporter substrate-binding protein [Nitrospinae bacterium]|nr:ABC transporter substrate-binding protein [Nitrospinota bacterium]